MSKTRAVLGIDLGTSQLKALIATPDGEILGRGRAAYPVVVPTEGHAETDPEDWWRAARTAVREALAQAANSATTATAGGAGTEIVGLAVTGQMHGVVLAGAVWFRRRGPGRECSRSTWSRCPWPRRGSGLISS